MNDHSLCQVEAVAGRNFSISALRVVSAFAVVMIHTAADVIINTTPFTANWWVATFLSSTSRFAVPVFVMISGALLLKPASDDNSICFYKKRFLRIIVPFLAWIVIYMIWVFSFPSVKDISFKHISWRLVTGNVYYHLWFLFLLPGLYAFTPFLRSYIRHSETQERDRLIAAIFVFACAHSMVNNFFFENETSFLSMFVPYIGYYLCGYQLSVRDCFCLSVKQSLIALIAVVMMMALGTGLLVRTVDVDRGQWLFDGVSILTIPLSILVFRLLYRKGQFKFQEHRIAVMIEKIAAASLGIYLVHPLIMSILDKTVGRSFIASYSLITIPVSAMFVFTVSFAAIDFALKIPILRRTVS